MFSHMMVGSNDLDRSKTFYDALFGSLGGKPGFRDDKGRLIYVHGGATFLVTTPIDGRPASAANGGTIGIGAASREQVLAWHAAGTAHGGTAIESPPSERPNGAFVAYLRDPDGNKLSVRTPATR